MTIDTKILGRKSIRLKEYDYSSAGAYFVTICTLERKCLFGKVVDGEMELNENGKIVKSEWLKTEEIRDNVSTDEFIIMPNHLHGILFIDEPTDRRGTVHRASTAERFGQPTSNSIPTIIRSFKATVTKQTNELRNPPGLPVWQRNYFDRIVRNDDELNRIREYIIYNLFKWQPDKENPEISKPKSTQDVTHEDEEET